MVNSIPDQTAPDVAAVFSKPAENEPNPQPAERPLVVYCIEALRTFGGGLNRDQAATVLPYWYRYAELDQKQIGVVLRRFPVAGSTPPASA